MSRKVSLSTLPQNIHSNTCTVSFNSMGLRILDTGILSLFTSEPTRGSKNSEENLQYTLHFEPRPTVSARDCNVMSLGRKTAKNNVANLRRGTEREGKEKYSMGNKGARLLYCSKQQGEVR